MKSLTLSRVNPFLLINTNFRRDLNPFSTITLVLRTRNIDARYLTSSIFASLSRAGAPICIPTESSAMPKNERHHNIAVLFQVTNRYFIALLYSVSRKKISLERKLK
jgi:hypothetical protein